METIFIRLGSAREMTCSPCPPCVIIHLQYDPVRTIYNYLAFTTSFPLPPQTHTYTTNPSTRYFQQPLSNHKTYTIEVRRTT